MSKFTSDSRLFKIVKGVRRQRKIEEEERREAEKERGREGERERGDRER